MADARHVLTAVLVAAVITWALRALPFALLAPLRQSRLLAWLDERMAVGVMVVLAAYTLRGTDPGSVVAVVAAVTGLAVTIGLHLWRGSMTLSILAGTAAHVAIMSTLG